MTGAGTDAAPLAVLATTATIVEIENFGLATAATGTAATLSAVNTVDIKTGE